MKKLDRLYLAYAGMAAEIEKLEAEPKGVWEPKKGETYYYVDYHGQVADFTCKNDWIDRRVLKHHNTYKTEMQAQKAAILTRQSNRAIQACINFDPDFVPNWADNSYKWTIHYRHDKNRWVVVSVMRLETRPAYVSTNEIAQSICDMFNEEDKA